jgi:tellurite resistance protein
MANSQHADDERPGDGVARVSAAGSSTRTALMEFLETRGEHGIAAELISLAAADALSLSAYLERVDSLPAGARAALEDIILDAVLFAIERALIDHHISPDEQQTLRQVKRSLGLVEGALYTRRAHRLAQILDAEMRRLLADREIDPKEALHQVELQEAFDLAYDEYLILTQPTAQRLVDDIIAEIVADGRVTREERNHLETRIRALDTAYKFTTEQRARLREAGLTL